MFWRVILSLILIFTIHSISNNYNILNNLPQCTTKTDKIDTVASSFVFELRSLPLSKIPFPLIQLRSRIISRAQTR